MCFLLANRFLVPNVPKLYMYEHPLSCFAAHSVVIFLTKEEIANCSPLGDLREINSEYNLKYKLKKVHLQFIIKASSTVQRKSIFNKFQRLNELCSAHLPLRINSHVTVSLENCYFLT